ncbi:hypothetical protein KDA_49840 [Dictyobacter alpinus]|uniref:Beta-galactosidase trimerisation domain-containing protein n=1 Tax=Dictyobacter alpinus TaxID=2014873 RepID=A0A402BDX7_9CHLR|nr:alpha-amylase family protein [Dictyobacter alpinus]GCE29500.1 hypothetical protein KDA_49840 [Dictyobacter alpinus]
MVSQRITPSRPLRRADSFLGIHFDFHAAEDSIAVGERVTRAMVENIIEVVQPDYIQCDCKGHYGYSSYPTRVGYPAPGIIGDPLRIWREVTAERGVALYMHYSGVWDTTAVQHHPQWARIDEHGNSDPDMTSTFGPYVDQLLIPQLKELCDTYKVDGVWIDGDCWATRRDHADVVIATFQQETGIEDVPRVPTDPHYFEFSQFCREGFRRYLRHYIDELHAHHPDFQIASNWAFSSKMPEPVSADVDFLSGDYALQDSVNSARLEGRCLRHQGKPWDLMAWSFGGRHSHLIGEPVEDFSTKSIVQLQREAAIVLSLGGGFQAYFQQDRNGAIFPWQMKLMQQVAAFCRERQAVCHHAESVPQVALLYAGSAFYRQTQELFDAHAGELRPMKGILQALLERQHSVDILMEHQLDAQLAAYPLLILPEWDFLTPDVRNVLLAYTHNGGNLLLIGPQCAALFEQELNVQLEGDINEEAFYLEHDGWLARVCATAQQVRLGMAARAFGRRYTSNDDQGSSSIAASITEYGRGKIAATYFNFGVRYSDAMTTVVRDFLDVLVCELFPTPLVKVTGSHCIDVAVNRLQGKLAINLVNTAGPHADYRVHVFDGIPPIGPLSITIESQDRPQKITSYPMDVAIPFDWEQGVVTLSLPRLEIYDILIVE